MGDVGIQAVFQVVQLFYATRFRHRQLPAGWVRCFRQARAGQGLDLAVITFEPLPHAWFRPETAPGRLTSPRQKLELFALLVEQYEREARYPTDLIQKLVPLGYIAPMIPEDYGGSFVDVMTYGVICEELARIDWVIASVVPSPTPCWPGRSCASDPRSRSGAGFRPWPMAAASPRPV